MPQGNRAEVRGPVHAYVPDAQEREAGGRAEGGGGGRAETGHFAKRLESSLAAEGTRVVAER